MRKLIVGGLIGDFELRTRWADKVTRPNDPHHVSSVVDRVSVIIPNFNYGEYVAQAVESALALDWPCVEVIVVDDGSTDRSRDILRTFGDRIKLILQDNAGPREACNTGFAHSQGETVIFLDSDDVLDVSLIREVARVWTPSTSKVQVQMRQIDASGARAGKVFPVYRFTPQPEEIRRWVLATSAYPTPPGSGNVYRRTFLESLFPLDDRCGDATDSACLAAAPFRGDVHTITKPLASYRIHENNRSRLCLDGGRFRNQILRARQRQALALEIAGYVRDTRRMERSLRRGRHLLQMRVAERRLNDSDPPMPGDTRGRLIQDSLVSLVAPGPEGISTRIATLLWCMSAIIAPESVARKLICLRFR